MIYYGEFIVYSREKVKVYDINKAVKESTEGKFKAFGFDATLVIIEGPNGIIVSNCDGVHGVHNVLDNEDQIRILMVENTESIYIFPSHSAYTSVAMLKSSASYTEMKLTEFIRRFGIRIESNYDILAEINKGNWFESWLTTSERYNLWGIHIVKKSNDTH